MTESRQCNANAVSMLGRLDVAFLLFGLLLLALLCSLGFWQLERAEEKRELAERHAARQQQSPIDLTADKASLMAGNIEVEALADRRVSLVGSTSENGYLLLDNRTRSGRVGYEVVALVRTNAGVVPVNLGWVAGDPARRQLPVVSLPSGQTTLAGRFYVAPGEAYTLADPVVPESLPAVIQAYDIDTLQPVVERLLGAPLLPVFVRVAPEHPLAYQADWPVVNQSPDKHVGYAVQWFTMACVLLIALIIRLARVASARVEGETHV